MKFDMNIIFDGLALLIGVTICGWGLLTLLGLISIFIKGVL